MRGIDTRRRRLRIQIKTGNGANDEIARILIIHLAGVKSALAGFQPAIALKIDHVLLRINAKIVVGKRPHNFWNAGKRDPEGAQVAVLHVGVALHAYARKQRGRQAPRPRAFGLVDPRVGDQHAEVGLERLLNRILQRQAIRRRLLGGAERSADQATERKNYDSREIAFHRVDSYPETAIALQKC